MAPMEVRGCWVVPDCAGFSGTLPHSVWSRRRLEAAASQAFMKGQLFKKLAALSQMLQSLTDGRRAKGTLVSAAASAARRV